MWSEFKTFAVKGNVVDMAVGIIIGGAFGKIVGSLVSDVLMPPIGLLLGNVDFSNLFLTLKGESGATLAEAQQAGAVTVNYGLFANAVITFFIVAFAVFLLVKQVNRWKTQPPPPEPNSRPCPFCLMEVPIQATRCGHCTSELPTAA